MLPVDETTLAEATPESLTELFSRDPEKLTQQDLNRIIAELRAQRARYLAAEAAPKAPKAPKAFSGDPKELGI